MALMQRRIEKLERLLRSATAPASSAAAPQGSSSDQGMPHKETHYLLQLTIARSLFPAALPNFGTK